MKQIISFPVCVVLAMLTACGAYFPVENTRDLQSQHREGVLPMGSWQDEELSLTFMDGGDDYDIICFTAYNDGDDDIIISAKAHSVPVEGGAIIILFDITAIPKEEREDLLENLIYAIDTRDMPATLKVMNAFHDLKSGQMLSFATPCDALAPEDIKPNTSFFPYCLEQGIPAQEIFNWQVAATDQSDSKAFLKPVDGLPMPDLCKTTAE